MVVAGKKAPAFTLESDSGEKVSLKDFAGKKVVLYFYPKDATPGWTQEASDFRDEIDTIASLNAVVLGVSKDSVASHQKFKAKHAIPFPLLSDPDKKICEKYGVLKERAMYGKKQIGVERSTFLIDEKGRISAVFRGVKVKGHVKQLLEDLRG